MAKTNPFLPGDAPASQPAAAPTPMPGTATANMDAYEVDLSEVSSGYTVDDGAYRVRCIEIEQSVSQAGNPMFIWTFVIVDGKFAGREFKLWTAITPAAMWKVAECVQALGVGQTGQVVKFKRSDVVNKECGAIIEQQEYNGASRSSIAKVLTLQELAAAQK